MVDLGLKEGKGREFGLSLDAIVFEWVEHQAVGFCKSAVDRVFGRVTQLTIRVVC